MNIRHFASTLAAASLLSGGGVVLDLASSFTPLAQKAQAAYYQNCPFTGVIAFSPTNVRSQTNTSSSIVKKYPIIGELVQFSTFDYGQSVPDAWTGQADNMWFKLADGSGYIASAVVKGYPPTSPCGESTLGIAVNWNSAAYRQNNPFWPTYAPPSVGGNIGATGNCTWYANGRLRELGYSSADLWKLVGNGKDWINQAIRAGIPTGKSAKVGAVAQWVSGGGGFGHVAVVEKVNNDGTIVISESSYSSNPSYAFLYKTRTITANSVENYIYVRR
jgi:surface antigen